MIEECWAETDNAIVQCLRERGAMSPVDLAQRLGMSPGEVTAFVCLLAGQGKVQLRLVEASEDARTADSRAISAGRRRERSRRTALASESVPLGHR